jgi:hypothetical protein
MGKQKFLIILGVALIVIGVAMLVYGHFTYKTQETVFQFGTLKATAETSRTVPLPPIIGWVAIGCGAVALIFGAVRPKA